MKLERSSGILLHPTSLPGPYGIGDLGPQAFAWIDFLARSGCSLWQVLPLGPTGYGDSPYQCFSAFAGNPYLVSPRALLDEDLAHPDDLVEAPIFPVERVDYGALIPWKLGLLERSYLRFQHSAGADLRAEYANFRADQAAWLEDFALFMALKEAHGGAPWVAWEAPLRDHQPQALEKARLEYAVAIERQAYRQFLFFRQWQALRQYAHQQGILIIGDAPIFVAHDSADVWARRELFFLDEKGRPTVVAGVPPDYFSPTGQLWGNPLYRWDRLREDAYTWWLERMRAILGMVDIVRLDHFRGFAGYWEVPGEAKTAAKGRWAPGPGIDFFDALRQQLGELPIIAEDLGVITPDVVEMRERFGLPGMKILQFGFEGGPKDAFLPHNYPQNCVAYTGTHDNDTARGWYERIDEKSKDFYRRYLARDGHDVSWDMIRAIWRSPAVFALAPMQDFLGLDNQARMNYPGNPSGNWAWRMAPWAMHPGLQARIREINFLYDRLNPATLALEEREQAETGQQPGDAPS
ncbi:MAG: 4-alpha-glucanotransferase [Anaerolineales bacterium]|nr:4-alpha-glucanotransferase [Anaerolineales bacterium]